MNSPNTLVDAAGPVNGAESSYPTVVFRGADGSEVVDCHPRDLRALVTVQGSYLSRAAAKPQALSLTVPTGGAV